MKNYEVNTPEEKLAMVPEEAVLEINIPGVNDSGEVIPVGLFCKEAREKLVDLNAIMSTANFEVDQLRKRIAENQKTIHDLRGNVMIEAAKISDSMKVGYEQRIKNLESQIELLKRGKK